ncbi:MAG: hypothetical protein A3C50_03485 [Candidatus Staskawiczbacteria bacterium RIFCSPHIGHO2_02_FULL_43_16]|uniref:Nudix hydrolase domain-containing protein n=1 Tax=Candidatus Staskawiczbacteria bacterium RIFCSPHIGHO2_01_FULL_41_41 TaxID=1802203 RepID=A0A1G2HSB9_9BACT|nr:MAG: hypothetical protein A2822_02590 [Candidatus Staskawiczbacteria bacterium RIFCSPHIGHO2_01_FULL_41_41]OGZ68001.1 MAG: hypothetical protein A3C50_03485 [Candidatus Staskawiczbacteria bacterium RIFCSPHIGHO2_02_FULL_43_16]OGZ74566.1 MAG: hypothetical protein A3A12_02285 [Candidatus Staskawiczbacteria bacterium RIFCSPLOWO2_01_FULL_43_17b]
MESKNSIDIPNLSQEEIKNLAVLLLNRVLHPEKGLGRELFNAIARLAVTLTPEAACLRRNHQTNDVEIYLIQRALDDTAYPGQWHLPGSAMRPQEEIDDVFKRLENNEIGLKILSKKFAFHFNNPKEERGHFFSLVYLCILDEGVGRGEWFALGQLPENIIEHHKKIVIPEAARLFQ